MEKKDLIRITSDIYRITLLFPKKEPLRYKTRELADKVLERFFKTQSPTFSSKKTEEIVAEALVDLEVLSGFFAIAESQNWVAPDRLFSVQEECAKIKRHLEELAKEKPFAVEIKREASLVLSEKNNLNERQQKILEILGDKEKSQVGEFKDVFPGVTKRTLRRDFQQLFKIGKIERIGEKNNTYYQILDRT